MNCIDSRINDLQGQQGASGGYPKVSAGKPIGSQGIHSIYYASCTAKPLPPCNCFLCSMDTIFSKVLDFYNNDTGLIAESLKRILKVQNPRVVKTKCGDIKVMRFGGDNSDGAQSKPSPVYFSNNARNEDE